MTVLVSLGLNMLNVWSIFLNVNDFGESKKKSILISSVGAMTYKLMKTLLALVKPREKTFDDLVKLVKDHECPQPSITVQRFKFNSRVQYDIYITVITQSA